ncbi:unnamed protein product, partial [Choristocarpus tenellus]
MVPVVVRGNDIARFGQRQPCLSPRHHLLSFRTILALCTLGSGVFVPAFTWINHYEGEAKQICPKRILCASSLFELVMITISRFSAGITIPSMVIAVLSKANNARTFVQHSSIGTAVDFEPTHSLHTLYGNIFLWASVVHSFGQIARIVQQDGAMLFDNAVSRSGLFAVILLLVSVLPMSWAWLKDKFSYETRKALHYIAGAAMISICFHSSTLCILSTILLFILVADLTYFYLRGTHLHYSFQAGSYAYVMCPTISPHE